MIPEGSSATAVTVRWANCYDKCSSLKYPLVNLLTRPFGLGHGAVVEQRRQYPADDRPQYVEPHAREVSCNEHRPEGARRVDRPAGHRSRDEHSYSQGESYRYGGDGSRSPLVCCHRHNHEDQDEGDQDLYDEGLQVSDPLCRIGSCQLRLAPRTCPAEGHPGGQGRQHRSYELRHYVVGSVLPGELARSGHPKGYGRVDVRPRDVAYGGDHGRQGEPEGERYG